MNSEGSSSERILRWIPALAALAVAALYSVGALLTAAGLRGAGLSIRDALPLVPLEKILARGISTLVASILLLVALVLLGALALSAADRLRSRDRDRATTIGASVLAGILLIVALAFTTPVLAAAILISLAAGVAATRLLPAVPRAWIWATQYVLLLVGLVASAFVYPQPLPTAQVETVEGAETIVGDLVTTTDFFWYVAGFEDDTVRAIPAARIEQASFQSRERDDPPMLKDLVEDLLE